MDTTLRNASARRVAHRLVLAALFLGVIALPIFAPGCGSMPAKPHQSVPGPLAASKPNILFIFSDDHATHAISAYGSKINQTPHIDRLAKEGAIFTRAYCGNSICGPSRAAILTGKHSHVNGFMRNGNEFDGAQPTFPKLLQKAGYQTAMIGKWHLSSDPTGFDHWLILPGQGSYYNPHLIDKDGKRRYPGHCTQVVTDQALDWLKNGRDTSKPFMMMCQHKAPHRSWMAAPEALGMYEGIDIPEPATLFDDYAGRGPAAAEQEMQIDDHLSMFYDMKLTPTEEEAEDLKSPDTAWKSRLKRMSRKQRAAWEAAYGPRNAAFRKANLTGKALVRWKYQRYIKNYLRCIAGVDESVGELLDYIDRDPVLKANTIVIYCSDQGFYLGDHGWYDKRWMYEESMKLPLICRWPERIAAGKKIDQLVQNIDFAPTFLTLAGVTPPTDMHGVSLVPLLELMPPDAWRNELYYHYYESHATHQVAAHYGIHAGRYKLIYFYEPERRYWELYDLEKDPDELKSVHDDPAYAAIRADLTTRLQKLRAKYGDTTGVLGDGTFDTLGGITSFMKTPAGYRVWGNARRAYALRPLEKPITGATTLTCEITWHGKPATGAILLSTEEKPRSPLRFYVDFRNGELSIFKSWRKKLARTPLPHDVKAPVTVKVTIDPKNRRAAISVGDTTVSAKLPKGMTSFTRAGYGLDNCKATFTEIVRE